MAAWTNGKGKSIFKYLVNQRRRPVHRERLMDVFWPEADADSARNNLNVAIYSARRALRCESSPCPILFENDCYLLNPALDLWVDYEVFLAHVAAARTADARGDRAGAVHELSAAERLYLGDFLEEHRYERWLVPVRESLRDDYRDVLERLGRHGLDLGHYDACIAHCAKLLVVDRCDERAHRRLMRCYERLGVSHLALRQYHACVEALRAELDTEPGEKTRALYLEIKARQAA